MFLLPFATLHSFLCPFIYAQPAQKNIACVSIFDRFVHLKKKYVNFSIASGISRHKVNSRNRYGFNLQAEVSYLPANYLVVGARFKPSLIEYEIDGRKIIAESNIFARYYPLSFNCYNTAFFAETGLMGDNSDISLKGERINKNTIYPFISMGVAFVVRKRIQAELGSDFFINRIRRTNLSVAWYFLSYNSN